MSSSGEQLLIAWQPLTPRGVAAFARARWGRLLLVQLLVAILAAFAIGWTVQTRWFTVISAAVERLPAQGTIRNGQLTWEGDSPQILAENRYLAITIDLDHQGHARSPAHLQIEFGRTRVKIFSLFGFIELTYPRSYVLSFNRPELGPWWGAWAPALLAMIFGAVIAGLMLAWALLAAVYSPVAWLFAFFANRDLSWRQSWRLAGAALMPGALILIVGLVLYGLSAMDPIRLLAAMALHFVAGWVFVAASPFFLPRHPEAPAPARQNPFDRGKSRPTVASDAGKT